MAERGGTKPFNSVLQRDLAMKCTDDVTAAVHRTFQICDTRQDCVIVATAGLGGAIAALAGALFAADGVPVTERQIDALWQQIGRDLAVHGLSVGGSALTDRLAALPAKTDEVRHG